MPELVKKADEVTSVGVQAGEGWLLTAEILELIESGCPNVICAQPFACLPNHVTGREQHRGRGLRSGCERREPAQPHQTDDRSRQEGSQGRATG